MLLQFFHLHDPEFFLSAVPMLLEEAVPALGQVNRSQCRDHTVILIRRPGNVHGLQCSGIFV
jgi:hypothetical protein